MIVLIGWETYLGLNDDPAILSGHGPVPAATVRDLADRATWRCAVIDDQHHTLLGLGRATFTPTYRPGDALTRHLTVRDRTCTFPGCRQPAHRTDLDHRTPYPDGVTCECNLAALCRTHHRLKHEAGYTVTTDPPRSQSTPGAPPTLTWTTPAGRRYQVRPEPLLPTGPATTRATAPTPPSSTSAPGAEPPAAAPHVDDDPPPF